MTETASKLKSQILALSDNDREELAQALLQSLGMDWATLDEEEWSAELDQRAADYETHPEMFEDADKVFREIREKYS